MERLQLVMRAGGVDMRGVHSYEDQVADEGEKPGGKEKNRRRSMCGIGWLICAGLGVGILDLK